MGTSVCRCSNIMFTTCLAAPAYSNCCIFIQQSSTSHLQWLADVLDMLLMWVMLVVDPHWLISTVQSHTRSHSSLQANEVCSKIPARTACKIPLGFEQKNMTDCQTRGSIWNPPNTQEMYTLPAMVQLQPHTQPFPFGEQKVKLHTVKKVSLSNGESIRQPYQRSPYCICAGLAQGINPINTIIKS